MMIIMCLLSSQQPATGSYTSVHNSPLLGPILYRVSPVRPLDRYSFRINPNIYPPIYA